MFWADAVGTATRSNPNDGRREKSAARGDRGPWFSREGRSQPSEGVRRRTARFWKAEIKAVPTVPSATYGSGFCVQNYVLYLKISLRAALFGCAQAKRYGKWSGKGVTPIASVRDPPFDLLRAVPSVAQLAVIIATG
ncbi:hypothetical protein THAOC_20476 [Thalassiosira oceanica]|uniref:Uncharacterized protein n=1 Tax=Thalassiosira oceanica TaxID=159749 RepID=K0RZR2_THAOC|nr:hypothetical protein THAOC_20476 [Thalassiosira oceanica]|eukprot:EJK59318.1 hypothetical protein THAOC_20476 [Thalassiosira oceanica]